MALRNQPYLSLYVQDYLTDEKLNSCSASTQGVYIKIMCVMHKSDEYGKILLKQKDKQKLSKNENFALKLSKLLPFEYETILNAISELVEEDVLIILDDELIQKRMVRDGEISSKRSEAGKNGGGNPILFKQKFKQTDKQITEDEYEYENDNNKDKEVKEKESVRGKEKEEEEIGIDKNEHELFPTEEKPKSWRTDYDTYLSELRATYEELINDKDWLKERQRYHPKLDIALSIEKVCVEYWATPQGWKKKKASKSQSLDWKSTLTKALNISDNKVYRT